MTPHNVHKPFEVLVGSNMHIKHKTWLSLPWSEPWSILHVTKELISPRAKNNYKQIMRHAIHPWTEVIHYMKSLKARKNILRHRLKIQKVFHRAFLELSFPHKNKGVKDINECMEQKTVPTYIDLLNLWSIKLYRHKLSSLSK
jgi:hypothetical protein